MRLTVDSNSSNIYSANFDELLLNYAYNIIYKNQ